MQLRCTSSVWDRLGYGCRPRGDYKMLGAQRRCIRHQLVLLFEELETRPHEEMTWIRQSRSPYL